MPTKASQGRSTSRAITPAVSSSGIFGYRSRSDKPREEYVCNRACGEVLWTRGCAMAFTRRYFFFGSLLAGAVPNAGFGSSGSLPRLGYKSPNEKLNIASIGAGGKAYSDIEGCSGENIVALCDVDGKSAARAYEKYPD